jgi:hypothetical protein
MTTKTPPLTLVEAELIVGHPAAEWAGHCYEMATKLEDAYRGSAVYGHWLGPVSPSSYFGYRAATGFVQHGWIEMPDSSVVDPTRWAFEAVDPYIYVGPNDYYDRGGNALRMRMAGPAPAATTEPGTALVISTPEAVTMLFAVTGWRDLDNLSDEQLRWLAHMSPEVYGFEHAGTIFQALADAGQQAFIPIDNWRWAMEEPLFSGVEWGEGEDDE